MTRTMGICSLSCKFEIEGNDCFIYLPPDIYSLAYVIHCSSLKDHPWVIAGES